MENNSPDYRLSVDTNGDVYVIDYNPGRRFIIFDNEGNYKKDIMVDRNYFKYLGHIYRIKIIGAGTFAALQHKRELPTRGIIFTLNPPEVKFKYPFNEKKIYMDWSMTFSTDFCGHNSIVDTDSEHIVFGNSQIYKFQVYDRGGNLKLKIEDKKKLMGSFNDSELEDI